MSNANSQTIREIAELVAKFRTPDWENWQPLADDICTVLKAEREACAMLAEELGAGFVEGGMSSWGRGAELGAQEIAAAIRNRA